MRPQSWNNGIVGGWSAADGSKDIVQFLFYGQVHNCINPIRQYLKTHFSNIPVFQHSNWSEAPNLSHRINIRTRSIDLAVLARDIQTRKPDDA